MARPYKITLQQTYQYNPSQTITIQIPRNAFVKKIEVLLSGNITNTNSSAVTLPGQPFPYNLVAEIRLVYNGNKVIYDASGTALGILEYYETQGQNPSIPTPGSSVGANSSVNLYVKYTLRFPERNEFPARYASSFDLVVTTPANFLPSGVNINASFVISVEYVDMSAEEVVKRFPLGLNKDGLPRGLMVPSVVEYKIPNVPASQTPIHVQFIQPGYIYLGQLIYVLNSNTGINNNDPTQYKLKITKGMPTDILDVSWQSLLAENQAEYKVQPYSNATAVIDYSKYFRGGLAVEESDSVEYDIALNNSDQVNSLFVAYYIIN
jgi:hypothetical protein